ncbi:MAG: hypothetical protein A2W90_04090 [Bacteroidetes bacterium GWF2_42_66]|nr:MAG: hypothetical protein A2W92_07885 [Bacteroidetes bacterium GWA2_42_15]OFY02498.1 MAG: hypothetical protein A2W89_21765 [Bacteroidetes bacterium GWE2_42_39]OFY41404.1 MAG: hypothetical protein A2W90_04090 [Bacteroidetes bacterium GWF2_42_66]HBL75392.1 DUF4922 domain-containing protein [Prolixibacteraceae bacterium]HCU60699.1 DUF4922 domain-containing protein [Prolixibacteraceae bacterium]
MSDFTGKVKQLLIDQKNNWPTARKNYSELENVQVRVFDFDGFQIKVQFNPARIISSSAKVDQQSIASRKCFLCAENRPAEQQQLTFGNYEILVNPFPIFPEHFTIPRISHVPQFIPGKIGDMLDLAKALPDFTIFYNGPKCGASAPDHFHFQAGKKGFMPLESEIEFLKENKGIKRSENPVDIWAIKDGIRDFLFMESSGKEDVESCFNSIYEKLSDLNEHAGEEPMMNILAGFENGKWQVFVFPRFRHRPWQYFEEGEKNILLSPASVDLGGVLITPMEKDFSKITKVDIADIFHQILWPEDKFNLLVEKLF